MFMGTTLTTELSLLTGEPSHVQESARQLIAFAGYLVDSSANDALYHHGYHHTDEARSCCKWGRGGDVLRRPTKESKLAKKFSNRKWLVSDGKS